MTNSKKLLIVIGVVLFLVVAATLGARQSLQKQREDGYLKEAGAIFKENEILFQKTMTRNGRMMEGDYEPELCLETAKAFTQVAKGAREHRQEWDTLLPPEELISFHKECREYMEAKAEFADNFAGMATTMAEYARAPEGSSQASRLEAQLDTQMAKLNKDATALGSQGRALYQQIQAEGE